MNNNQKPTTVGGVPTGNMTQSGNPTHNPDGTFGSGKKTNSNLINSFNFDGSNQFDFLNNLDLNGSDQFDFLNDLNLDDTVESFDYNKKRTSFEVIENFDSYLTDDILSWLEENQFFYKDKFKSFFGQRNTMYATSDKVLLNAIANVRFRPINVLSSSEFMALKNSIFNNKRVYQNPENQNMTYCERGFGYNSRAQRMGEYTGSIQTRLRLPYGVHGSAVYSAYDVSSESSTSSTARSYAGPSGFIMKFIIDNKKSNIISEASAGSLRSEFLANFDKISAKITQKLANSKYSPTEQQSIIHAFRRTLETDITFAPLLCGYDMVYNNSSDFAMILNFGNAYTYKNW